MPSPFFIILMIIIIGVKLLYHVVLVSVQQHESAMCIHICLPF